MWRPALRGPRDQADVLLDGLRVTLRKASALGSMASLPFAGNRTTEGPRFRAFISYSHRDAKIARWLHHKIETYAIPGDLVGLVTDQGPIPRRLSPVFRDEDELASAAELKPELEAALRDSAALLVICSPAAAQSIWVDREIRLYKQLNPTRPVLAVISEGAPGGCDDCFPAALRLVAGPDGALIADETLEPLAPDLQKQDRQVVRLKLVAGLLGVKYNDLFRRDRRRARRVRAAIGTLALVIIAALSTLSIAAVQSAREAVKERNAARQAQLLAEHNADLAERRAWLAQVAAIEVRRQSAIIGNKGCRTPITP